MTAEQSHQFVAYWDEQGFECVLDITSYERQALLASIKGDATPNNINLHMMMLRARFNPQRAPEIWAFESTVDQSTLQELSEDDPQLLANTIRKCGHCLFKTSKSERKIV